MSQQPYVCEKVDNKEDREKIECETKTRAREFQKQKQNFFSKHWPSTNIKANQKCRNEQIYRKELLLYNDRTEMRCVERVCVWARERAHLNRERERSVFHVKKNLHHQCSIIYINEKKQKLNEKKPTNGNEKTEEHQRFSSCGFETKNLTHTPNRHTHPHTHTCIHTSRSLRRAHILNKTKQSIHRKAASWFRAHQIYIRMKIKSFSSNRKLNLRSVIVE